MDLSIKQKEILAQFFGNLAVAWLAGGVIGPFVVNWNIENINQVVYFSVLASIILVGLMLYLVKEVKNE